jgi:hypothetical protein
MMVPRLPRSIDWALREVAAAIGPRTAQITGGPAGDVAPPRAAPFTTGLVATRRLAATEALRPLVAPGSRFFEFIVDVGAWSFYTLCITEAIRQALSGPGLTVGKVILAEPSLSDLVWSIDIVLGISGGTISGRWRAFALDHRLLVGHRLIFCFKLGMREASVWVFDTHGVRRTYPVPPLEE